MPKADNQATSQVVRFADFEVHLRTREIRKNGMPIKLTGHPFDVLAALVARPGELITRDELRQRLWADSSFVDFDNNLNNAVNRLRRALGDSAEDPRFVETLPRLGYRFLSTVEPAESGNRRTRLLRSFAFAAMVLIVATVAWLGFRPVDTGLPDRVMLVVLPFENLGSNPAEDYLSDGLTEELILQLSRIDSQRLGIIARTTAMKYRGTPKSVAEIGDELGVDYVVEGSVRRGGDTVRITAQLIRVGDETHLWAESYDREPGDLLALEHQVARAVAGQIQVAVSPGQASIDIDAIDPDAYDAYLRARYYHSRGTVQSTEQAIGLYRDAIEKSPDFALAHAGLARAYIFGIRTEPIVALERAYSLATNARELEPNLPEALVASAMATLYHKRDLAAAEQLFQRALQLDPGNSEAHFYYAQCLAADGRFDEAIASAQRALEVDPFSPLILHYIGRLHYFARDYDKAIGVLRETLDLDPNYPWAHLFLAVTYQRIEAYEQAVEHRQKYWAAMGVSADQATKLGDGYAEAGYESVLRDWYGWIEGFARVDGYVTSSELAILQTELGNRDEAFAWLEKALEHGTRDLIYINVEPAFDPLRGDPRFSQFVQNVGM